MAFFNLTMLGHQDPLRYHKNKSADETLPPINCPKLYEKHFSKSFDSNIKYHELRTKHIREPLGNQYFSVVLSSFHSDRFTVLSI